MNKRTAACAALILLVLIVAMGLSLAGSLRTTAKGIGAARVLDAADVTAIRIDPNDLLVGGHGDRLRGAPENLVPALRKFSLRAITRWSELDHAIRLWGPTHAVVFGNSTARPLLDPVCREEVAHAVFPVGIHQWTRNGLRFRGPITPPHSTSRKRLQGELHRNSMLASLGEAGVPSTTVIEGLGTVGTVADVIRAAMADFNWDQRELEWTTVALALYIPCKTWYNKFGQTVSFDELATRLCEQPFEAGACFGTHRPYALSVILAVDAGEPLLSASVRSQVEQWLTRAARFLHRSQAPSGFWGTHWSNGTAATIGQDGEEAGPPEIVVTGHTLEWLAIWPRMPSELLKDVERAAAFLTARILESKDDELTEDFAAYSHACRALRCWFPAAWDRATSTDR